MANWIKQGDACAVPLRVSLNGAPLDAAEVETVEVMLGELRKLYPGEVLHSPEDGCFYIPLSQEETLALPADGAVAVDLRVRFHGGRVLGARRMQYLTVADAVSKEVLA